MHLIDVFQYNAGTLYWSLYSNVQSSWTE